MAKLIASLFYPVTFKNTTQNTQIPLYAEDTVFFFLRESRQEVLRSLLAELRKQNQSGQFTKIVRISGAVHFPQNTPYTDSMVLSELIRAAGGSKDSAYLFDAEITRLGIDEDQKAFVEHLRVGRDMADSNLSQNFALLHMTHSPLSRYLYGEKGKALKSLEKLTSRALTPSSWEKLYSM